MTLLVTTGFEQLSSSAAAELWLTCQILSI